MIWSVGSNRFCCLRSPSERTSSKAGKDGGIFLAAVNKVITNTGPLLVTGLNRVRPASLQVPLQPVQENQVYNPVFDPFLHVHIGVKGQVLTPYPSGLVCLPFQLTPSMVP